MKTIKLISKIALAIALIIGLSIGFIVGKRYYKAYQAISSLDNTVLANEIEADERLKGDLLQEGQILSKTQIDISTIPVLWDNLAEDDTLKTKYAHLNNINFYVIVYKSDDLLVNGIIAEPKKDGIFPVIIFNRGGNKEIGKSAKAKTLYSVIYAASKLVNEGYLVLASCYRESDEFGGNDIHDVLNLTKTAQELEKADANRIGMFGWSRGGMMTYLALKNSIQIQTAVVGNGPSDLSKLIIERPEMESKVCAELIPNYEANKVVELEKRSVIHWVDQLDKEASLLIICGTEDKRVNPNQAKNVANELTKINYDFLLQSFETNHKFTGKRTELNELLINWFKERL